MCQMTRWYASHHKTPTNEACNFAACCIGDVSLLVGRNHILKRTPLIRSQMWQVCAEFSRVDAPRHPSPEWVLHKLEKFRNRRRNRKQAKYYPKECGQIHPRLLDTRELTSARKPIEGTAPDGDGCLNPKRFEQKGFQPFQKILDAFHYEPCRCPNRREYDS
jgi:hypothetical protein